MRRYLLYLTAAILAFGISVFFSYKSVRQFHSPTGHLSPKIELPISLPSESTEEKTVVTPEKDEAVKIETIFTNENLSYQGFDISRQFQKQKFNIGKLIDVPQDRGSGIDKPFDVPVAVIEKNGKKIFEFDGKVEFPLRAIRFGLFPLLGDENNRQLIIESSDPDHYRYAVINLSPKFEVLFDSSDYALSEELKITDSDKDGKYELIDCTYNDFYLGTRYRRGIASTEVLFNYDEASRKYLFANRKFESYLFKSHLGKPSIEDQIAHIKEVKADKSETEMYSNLLYSAVMEVFLSYAYVGEEKEAWTYFEEYDAPYKKAARAEVKRLLANDRFYKLARKSEE